MQGNGTALRKLVAYRVEELEVYSWVFAFFLTAFVPGVKIYRIPSPINARPDWRNGF